MCMKQIAPIGEAEGPARHRAAQARGFRTQCTNINALVQGESICTCCEVFGSGLLSCGHLHLGGSFRITTDLFFDAFPAEFVLGDRNRPNALIGSELPGGEASLELHTVLMSAL